MSGQGGYLTVEQAATYLNIKAKTLYASKDKKPEIHYYRLGRLIRFKKEDLDAWMEKQKIVKTGYASNTLVRAKSFRKTLKLEIDGLVRRTIDEAKSGSYTQPYGKSDRNKSSGKEA
jgi:excisionase family DNA binding protein